MPATSLRAAREAPMAVGGKADARGRLVMSDGAGAREYAIRSARLRIVPGPTRDLLLFSIRPAGAKTRRPAVWREPSSDAPLDGFRSAGPAVAPDTPELAVRIDEDLGDRAHVVLRSGAGPAGGGGWEVDAWFDVVVRRKAATPPMALRRTMIVVSFFGCWIGLIAYMLARGIDPEAQELALLVGSAIDLVVHGTLGFAWFFCPVCRRNLYWVDGVYDRRLPRNCRTCGAPV